MSMISKKTVLTASLAFIALASTCSAIAAVTFYAYQDRVSPRTTVAGLSVGNLPHGEAARLIIEKQAEIAQTTVRIAHLSQTASISLADLGVTVAEPAMTEIIAETGRWSWLDPHYWRRFLSQKDIALQYSINRETAQRKVEEVFNIRTTARNANLNLNNGELVIEPAADGESLGLKEVFRSIEHLVTLGAALPAALTIESVKPDIQTAAVIQTKTEIERAIRPIYVRIDNRDYVIPKTDLYAMIDYTPVDGALQWRINEETLSVYVTNKIAARANVKMLERLVQSDTQAVTQQGRDGKRVDIEALISGVKRTITEQIDTSQLPITVPVQTIAFTERIVPPGYVAGLFEGLYVDINLTQQRLYIMNGQTNTETFIISSGKRGTPTPVGVFYVKNKIELARSRLYPGIWMRNWNALAKNPDGSGYEGYGIHDLPAFNAAYTIVEGASHLGRPVSHGCIRLGHEQSVWFYQNIPVGTPVNIHY